MQNGTLGERSPNHHGVNGRFCPFNGCWRCDLHVLRTGWRPRTPNLSAFAQVGHVPTYIFGSIQHWSAPCAILSVLFGTQIAPDRHKKCPRWQITPSGALKTVVLHLIQGMPMLNTPKNARRKRGVPAQSAKFPQVRSSGRHCWQTPSRRRPSGRAPSGSFPTADNRPAS